ncbi:MAG: hypothetical protein RLZZ175_3007 [Bacteroidota bacterium]|jgi:hypothetical protein
MHFKSLTALVLFFISFNVVAQTKSDSLPKRDLKFNVELGLSANSYRGSLVQHYGSYTQSYHVGIRFSKKKLANGRVNFSYGNIEGQNSSFEYKDSKGNVIKTNNYFKTSIFSLAYELNIKVIERRKFVIQAILGVGAMRFTPYDQFENNLINNQSTRAAGETYSSTSLYLPLGLQFMYKLPQGYNIGMSANVMNPLTDFLDNTSKYSAYTTSDNVLMLKLFVSTPISLKL